MHAHNFNLRRNASATDLTYIVQSANTLGAWADLMTFTAGSGWVANAPGATASESAVIGTAPDSYLNVTITDPTAVTDPLSVTRYFRFVVHR